MPSFEIFRNIFNNNDETKSPPPIPPRPIRKQKSNIPQKIPSQHNYLENYPPQARAEPASPTTDYFEKLPHPFPFTSTETETETPQNLTKWRQEFRRLIIKIYLQKPRRLSEINKIATTAFGGKKDWAERFTQGRRNGLYTSEELFICETLVKIGVVGARRMDGGEVEHEDKERGEERK